MQNGLLNVLTTVECERLRPHLERVPMEVGSVLYESGATLEHAYFPIDCIVSLLYVMDSGATTEFAVVGNEGMIGIYLFMGGGTTPSQAVVRSEGYAYRLKAQVLKDEFRKSGPIQDLLLRYAQALLTQTSQTAVCNRYHEVEQQLCRWLLLSLDRLVGCHITMTHGQIANIIGVRREGITEAAGKLQTAGLISYSRGKIAVLDRPGLEDKSCECYIVVKREYDRLLPEMITR